MFIYLKEIADISLRGDIYMAKKRRSSKNSFEVHRMAHYAFFAGLILAFVIALAQVLFPFAINQKLVVTVLFTIGAFVGLFNLTVKETQPFLLAAVALMLAGIVNLSLIPLIGHFLRFALQNIVVFVVPGAIIVGMKAIWRLASD